MLCSEGDVFDGGRTGPDGRFSLHAVYPFFVVGAHQDGYAPSGLHELSPERELRIELPSPAAVITGRVVDGDGLAVANACLRVRGEQLPERWRDPDTDKTYYTKAPGLSYDAAQWLAGKRIVAIGLDTPFVDTVPEGMLAGKAGPAAGTPPGLPFAVHHHMLSQAGIHLIENARLDQLAADRVWLSCAMVLPLLDKGAAGSAVRPIAIGATPKPLPRRAARK